MAVCDKTGTITVGAPRIDGVIALDGRNPDSVLRFAAAVEQCSGHRLARVVVDAALARGLEIPVARSSREKAGEGVVGIVDGQMVRVGSRSFVLGSCCCAEEKLAEIESRVVPLRAYVCIDGRLVGVLDYADELRSEVRGVLEGLRQDGVRRVILLSGDHAPNARAMAERAGIHEVRGDLLPEEKASIVRQFEQDGEVVMMVGDGINDAPRLSSG